MQSLPQWRNTAAIIAYDDSDGWYDHVMGPIVNQSNTSADALTGPGSCGEAGPGAYQGRCGYGPRLPLLAISHWAKVNFVDHQVTDQTSILRFIEDNWNLGRIGDQSFDEKAESLESLFDFTHRGPRAKRLGLKMLIQYRLGHPGGRRQLPSRSALEAALRKQLDRSFSDDALALLARQPRFGRRIRLLFISTH